MNIILILNLLLLYTTLVSSSINFNNGLNFKYNTIRLRNSYLRLKLSTDFSKIKYYYNKFRLKTLNMYYELSSDYYSLSQDERTLIETIISMSY